MNDVFVHPKAINDSNSVGAGTRIWAFAHVLDGSTVGPDCNLGEHVFIEAGASLGRGVTVKNHVSVWEGVTLENYVFVGPAAAFTNDPWPRSGRNPVMKDWGAKEHWLTPTRVQEGASIGAHATLMCGLTVGRYALIGAGTLVLRDVPAHALVVGSPARVIGWVCACGQRLDADLRCARCGRAYARQDDALVEV